MKIPELMQTLVTMFPKSALGTQTGLEEWARLYRGGLQAHEGLPLQGAFDTCMAGWSSQTFPKPADIAKHLPKQDARTTQKIDGYAWAHRILSGDWGKRAVAMGVAGDLDIWLERNPGECPDLDLLEKFARDAAVSAAMMREPRNQIQRLPGLHAAMRGREAMLARKYGGPVAVDDPFGGLTPLDAA